MPSISLTSQMIHGQRPANYPYTMKRKGITANLMDCYLAVIAQENNCKIFTLDRHFKDIKKFLRNLYNEQAGWKIAIGRLKQKINLSLFCLRNLGVSALFVPIKKEVSMSNSLSDLLRRSKATGKIIPLCFAALVLFSFPVWSEDLTENPEAAALV